MIPQDRFVIVASVASGNVAGLRERLAQMNFPGRTGFADPSNHLVPFGEFDTIHFARFVVLVDNTLGDREAYRKAGYPDLPEDEPTYLCFMVDCDGDADELLQHMVQKAGAGLQEKWSPFLGATPGAARSRLAARASREAKGLLCQLGRAHRGPGARRSETARSAA